MNYFNGMASFTKMNDALDSISKISNNPIVCYFHREDNLRSLWYILWNEDNITRILKVDFDGVYFPKYHFNNSSITNFNDSYSSGKNLMINCSFEDFEKENRLVINGDTLVVDDGYNPKDIFIVSVSGKKYEFTNANCIDSSVMIIQSSLYRFGLIGYWFK